MGVVLQSLTNIGGILVSGLVILLSFSAMANDPREVKTDPMRALVQKFPDLVCEVHLSLNQRAEIVGAPAFKATGGTEDARRTFCNHAVKSVRRSAPFRGLPAEKYDRWKVMVVRFDASQMGR